MYDQQRMYAAMTLAPSRHFHGSGSEQINLGTFSTWKHPVEKLVER